MPAVSTLDAAGYLPHGSITSEVHRKQIEAQVKSAGKHRNILLIMILIPFINNISNIQQPPAAWIKSHTGKTRQQTVCVSVCVSTRKTKRARST